MSHGAAAAVAGHDPVVRPPDGLLVDELDGGIRAGLFQKSKQLVSSIRTHNHNHNYPLSSPPLPVCAQLAHRITVRSQRKRKEGKKKTKKKDPGRKNGRRGVQQRTCSSKSVCSNRGPVMATDRGRWLRDHTSARFGACATAVGAGPSVTWGSVCVLAVAGVVVVVVVVVESGAESRCWRAVAVNARLESCRGRPCTAARSRVAYIVCV